MKFSRYFSLATACLRLFAMKSQFLFSSRASGLPCAMIASDVAHALVSSGS